MKAQIAPLLEADAAKTMCSSEIHVVDHTNQSGSARGLEAYDSAQSGIQSFRLTNASQVCIEFAPFAANKLVDLTGKEIKHCECILFPSEFDAHWSWILFLEMKYSEPKSKGGSGALRDAMNQLFSTLDYFRQHGLIHETKLVYLIASIPNRPKVPFENSVFSPAELKSFFKNNHAIVRGVNSAVVVDATRLKV